MTARSRSSRATVVKVSSSPAITSAHDGPRSPAPTRTTGPAQPPSLSTNSGAVTTTFAPESSRMWPTSTGPSRNTTGTITAPVFKMPV